MSSAAGPLPGPDFVQGVDLSQVPEDGVLLGHVGAEAVLLVRRGEALYAVGASCTHYGAPLADGVVIDEEIRCPWHHARFGLRDGEAVGPPALNPLPCWEVKRSGGKVFVGDRRAPTARPHATGAPESIVIVGAGAAGNAAVETLRREGYSGELTMIGAEDSVPVDRPNLSKDYLAGSAPEEWVALRGNDFYSAQRIGLLLGVKVVAIDPKAKRVQLSDGSQREYGALLIATGADPIRLVIPGSELEHVHYLRSLADSRAIISRAKEASQAVVIGASFIGLEVAASLRARGVVVHVVAPEAQPLVRVMGPELGEFIRALHEAHGVHFHLGRTAKAITGREVVLDDGQSIAAELVVIGIGVKPAVALAEGAGLRVDRGVLVDQYLETSVPGIYAAGDIARWPDPRTGRSIRIEHWVLAELQGQTAARNMLGRRDPFRAVPFFWSQHYDTTIAYVGSAEGWDRVDVRGNLAEKNCLAAFRVAGKITAVATIGRDHDSLRAEALLEHEDQAGLEMML